MSSETMVAKEASVVEVIFEKDISSSEDPPREEWSSLDLEIPEENIKRLKYAKDLYDPGSGEICAKYIALSASSVLQHVYYNYPGIKDPGIEDALLRPEPEIIYSNDGQELYLALCKEADLCPVRSFYRGLIEKEIDLKYYGIHPKNFRVMAMALSRNRIVTVLDLTDNWISEDGCFHLGDMLIDNVTLKEMNLTGCRIGLEGARRLFENLHLNRALRTLNLSRNELSDLGVELLANAIFKGADLTNINLSFNKLTGISQLALAKAFETHNKLTHLDMSWNSMLSPKPIFALCTQLSTNLSLQEVNFSWNYLGGERIGDALALLFKNPNIRHINLSNNKLEGNVIKSIAFNLTKCTKLDTLNLSFNPLSIADAVKLVSRLTVSKVKLKRLLLDNVTVDSEFMKLRDEVLSNKLRGGTVITYGDVKKKFVPKGTDIRNIVFDRCEAICKKPKKHKVDISLLIQQMYRDNPQPMSIKIFTRDVRDAGAALDDDLIEELANRFPGPKSDTGKMINLVSVIDYLKRKWPERKLPPTPPPEPEPEPVPVSKKKVKKGKKDKKKK